MHDSEAGREGVSASTPSESLDHVSMNYLGEPIGEYLGTHVLLRENWTTLITILSVP